MGGRMEGSKRGRKETEGQAHRMSFLILCFFCLDPRHSILQELRLQSSIPRKLTSICSLALKYLFSRIS